MRTCGAPCAELGQRLRSRHSPSGIAGRFERHVFGAPSTVVEGIATNTQLTGDGWGLRQKAAENGVFFDVYSTTVLQGIVSGSDGSTVNQHFDAFLTLDSGRMGLWPGGQLNFSVQSKIGDSLNQDTGTIVPTNAANIFPVTDDGNFIYPTGYYLMQGLHPTLGITFGKMTTSSFADQNVFANQYRHQFQSSGLNNTIMLGQYSPPSTSAGFVLWRPMSWLTISAGALDPNGSAANFADDFFEDAVFVLRIISAYDIAGKPGHLRTGFVMNFAEALDLTDPIEIIDDGIDFQTAFRTVDNSYMFYVNFDQYLWVRADPEGRAPLDHPRDVGFFGRFGAGPSNRNFIDFSASFGLGARGPFSSRPYDQMGVGFYRIGISDDFERWAADFNELLNLFPDGEFGRETGIELYYSFALTPAFQLTLDMQYLIDPLLGDEDTLIMGGRIQVSF